MTEFDIPSREELALLTRIRRDLHAHAQLRYEETYASRVVQDQLHEWGIPFTSGIAETGVVAWIDPPHAPSRHPAVGLRADLDALPIHEETGLPYASKNAGVMHACGHDGHTAVLLGAAHMLWDRREKLPQPIKLIFQPAEEDGAGAKRMTEAGVLSDKIGGRRVQAMFGLHCSPLIPVGTYATKIGPLLAGCCDFEVVIHGTGGHAALPHLATDPIVGAAQVINAAQTLVSRNCDPMHAAVVSICTVHGGDAANVIPDSVKLTGTIRSHEDGVFEMIRSRFESLCQQVVRGLGCRAEVVFTPVCPSVMNDKRVVQLALSVADRLCGPEQVVRMDGAVMGSEDFAYYSRVVPSCFGFIGVANSAQDSYPMLHTPQFDFNDAALKTGIQLMCGFAFQPIELN
jgi:hippurate hydrolase